MGSTNWKPHCLNLAPKFSVIVQPHGWYWNSCNYNTLSSEEFKHHFRTFHSNEQVKSNPLHRYQLLSVSYSHPTLSERSDLDGWEDIPEEFLGNLMPQESRQLERCSLCIIKTGTETTEQIQFNLTKHPSSKLLLNEHLETITFNILDTSYGLVPKPQSRHRLGTQDCKVRTMFLQTLKTKITFTLVPTTSSF